MGLNLEVAPSTATPSSANSVDALGNAETSVMILKGSPSWLYRQKMAAKDLSDGLGKVRLIAALGWLDIRLRYRGSLLGPFWLTLTTAVMVGALGFVYSTLFHQTLRDYLPYLALSLVLWNATAAVVGEASIVFTSAEASIRSMRLPFTVHAWRLLVRQLLILLHNAVVIIVVFAIFRIWPGHIALLAIPGTILWLTCWLAASLLLGCLCARFRDIPQIVNSVMQIAFYVTPVVWRPEQMRGGARYLPLNPFYDLLEVVRAPLIGQMPPASIWEAAVGFTVLVCVLGWVTFSWARGRLAFWI